MEIDATGLAVTPGFINMLSWANESLIDDGRSQGDIRQGVTTEVIGEGRSMGPLTPDMKARLKAMQGDITFEIKWTTLREYLEFLERKGVSPNVASFIGAATVREYVMGDATARPPPPSSMRCGRSFARKWSWGTRYWLVADLRPG